MPGVFARSEMEQVRRMIPRENSFLTGASRRLILEGGACGIEESCGLKPKKPIVREARKSCYPGTGTLYGEMAGLEDWAGFPFQIQKGPELNLEARFGSAPEEHKVFNTLI
jgi:hypothetical protein